MAVEKMQGLDLGGLLQGAAQIAGLFGDKTTKTSGGTTSGSKSSGLDITDEGRKKMITDILSSSNGLAATASGQKQVGLYNSSTNQQLVNDLVDRASSSVDRDTAKTVESTTQTTSGQKQVQEAQFGLKDAALAGAGIYGAGKLCDLFGSGSEAAGGAASTLPSITNLMSTDFGLGSMSGALDFGGMGLGGYMGPAMDLLSGDTDGALASGAGMMIGNYLMPGVGGPIGAMLMNSLPIGNIISGVTSGLGGMLGSVVCSELHMQGRMSWKLYISDVNYAAKHMSPVTLEGYRLWGVPLVKWMRKSKRVSAIAGFFAINRAHYIAKLSGVEHSSKRAAIGAVINTVGVPICYVIGTVIKLANYKVATKSLYAGV